MFSRIFVPLCLLCGWLAASGLAEDADYSEKLSDAEKGLLAAINKERRAEGAADLKVHGKLMAAARIHARNMAAADSGKHELKDLRPEWRTPEDRIKHVEYRGFAWGENIAWGYPRAEQVTAGWMTSEGHRRNMLNADFEEVGLGVARGASGPYWCAVFGRSSSPPPLRPEAAERAERSSQEGSSTGEAPRRASTAAAAEAWRYRWHEGHWWYYLPSKQWVVWVDGQWVKPR